MLRFLMCFVALSLVVTWAFADDKNNKKTDSSVADEAKKLFDKYDLNKDDYIDKAELAKMFRGSSAKPVDVKKDDVKKDDAKKDAKPPKLLPDEEFLNKWDKNGDEKISRDEFQAAYADWVKQQEKAAKDQQKQMQQQQHYSMPHGGAHPFHK